MGETIFVRANYFMGLALDNLGVKKVLSPQNVPRNGPKVIFPKTKKISQILKISGTLVILCPIATRAHIYKWLRSPGIDSEESIPGIDSASLQDLVWLASTTNRVVLPARQCGIDSCAP